MILRTTGSRSRAAYDVQSPTLCHAPGQNTTTEHEWGPKQVSKRSTHVPPGMHMQQCPAVPQDNWW